MEFQKINKLLGHDSDNEFPKYFTKKNVTVNSFTDIYDWNKEIRFKTSMLRNDLCDYNDAYLVVNGKVNADFIGDSNYNNAYTNGDINNVFPNALFPENLFPLNIFDGADDAVKSAARTDAHANLINVARNAAKTSAVNKAYIEKYKQNLFLFKNNAPFINCTLKINSTIIDNAEDLDVVMPIYNILEYSKNYQKNNGNFLELL